MNPVTNKFEPLRELDTAPGQLVRPDGTPVPAHWTQFTVGEHVVIKNYTFKVAYLGETAILFEPVGPIVLGGNSP